MPPMSSRALASAALVAALMAGACGGEPRQPSAGDVLERASSRFAERGRLDLQLALEPERGGGARQLGLSGPYSASDGRLDAFDARMSANGPDLALDAQMTAVGGDATVSCGGDRWSLGPSDAAGVDDAATMFVAVASGMWRALPSWVEDPRVADAGRVDGKPAWRVTGAIDFARLAEAIDHPAASNLAAALGPPMERAVGGDRIELVIGKDDGLLRRLSVSGEVRETDELLQRGVTMKRPGAVRLTLTVTGAGEPQDIEVPATDDVGPLNLQCG